MIASLMTRVVRSPRREGGRRRWSPRRACSSPLALAPLNRCLRLHRPQEAAPRVTAGDMV